MRNGMYKACMQRFSTHNCITRGVVEGSEVLICVALPLPSIHNTPHIAPTAPPPLIQLLRSWAWRRWWRCVRAARLYTWRGGGACGQMRLGGRPGGRWQACWPPSCAPGLRQWWQPCPDQVRLLVVVVVVVVDQKSSIIINFYTLPAQASTARTVSHQSKHHSSSS